MAALFIASMALLIFASSESQAQTFTVLHTFTGENDGGYPASGLLLDAAGNLYGETSWGGDFPANCSVGCGTVFKLGRHGTNWFLSTLYAFKAGNDGAYPAGIYRAADGTIYGVTSGGGIDGCVNNRGCGTVFKLTPSAAACHSALCPWTETVLYRFTGSYDGGQPGGNPIFDSAGNLYDTAEAGGYGYGVAFKLSPSGGSWTESVLYAFTGQRDANGPNQGMIFDHQGNLDGLTASGGENYWGTVFQLTPTQDGWTETLIHQFDEYDGGNPTGGLLLDGQGNLYASAPYGTSGWSGLVFELTPGPYWSFYSLYDFNAGEGYYGPFASLIMDAAGDIYGTTHSTGAYHKGVVFKLTPSGGGWTYTSLHDFTGGSDGAGPDYLVMDASGNLFGEASTGAGDGCYNQGCGVIFEITP